MRNSDLLEQLQQKDVTYVYNLSGHNVLNSLINLKQLTFEVTMPAILNVNIAVMEISMKRMEKERISFFSLMLLKG